MELHALKQLWMEQDQKLDQVLSINQKLVREITLKKAKSKLNSVLFLRIVETVIFSVIMIVLGNFIADNISNIGLVVSAVVLDIFCIIGLAGSIGQIIHISQLDYTGPVVAIQKQLKKIQAHQLQFFRLAILSFPFYPAFILVGFKMIFGIDLLRYAEPDWLIVNLLIQMLLLIPAIWLYRKLSLKKPVKNWVLSLARSLGDQYIYKAAEFLHEIEDFKQED